MHNQQIDYASLVEKALLRVVHDVLGLVAAQGLPGRHHLYITFRTDHAGVVMDDSLHARYPNEMTIVLQHEYWALEVGDDRFAVTLRFNGVPHRVEVPMEAVTVFADPSVEFGLQFTRAGETIEGKPAPDGTLPAAGARPDKDDGLTPVPVDDDAGVAAGSSDSARKAPADEAEDGEKIVTLDRFRKK